MAKNDLAPGLLLAAPRLGDPNFERTVVLLGRHEPVGALGWVVNGRALGSVQDLLRESNLVEAGTTLPTSAAFRRVARIGGPVANNTGWIVYRREPGLTLAGEIELSSDLGVTGDATALAAVMRGEAPHDFRLLIGYAGWGPGQLEGEVRDGAWLPANVNADLVLGTAPEELWNAAYRHTIGADPAAFTSTRRGQA